MSPQTPTPLTHPKKKKHMSLSLYSKDAPFLVKFWPSFSTRKTFARKDVRNPTLRETQGDLQQVHP